MLYEASLLDDLRALVEFAQAGFIAGAADRLYRTRSAITGNSKGWRLRWVPEAAVVSWE